MSITVYGKDGCIFCQKAVYLAETKSISYDYIDVSDEKQKLLMKERIRLAGGTVPKTVPQIFEGAKYIGGYEDLEKHFSDINK